MREMRLARFLREAEAAGGRIIYKHEAHDFGTDVGIIKYTGISVVIRVPFYYNGTNYIHLPGVEHVGGGNHTWRQHRRMMLDWIRGVRRNTQ